VANFPDGPPADFATRPAGRQETEDATSPLTSNARLVERHAALEWFWGQEFTLDTLERAELCCRLSYVVAEVPAGRRRLVRAPAQKQFPTPLVWFAR
jgi:hypothetical protein